MTTVTVSGDTTLAASNKTIKQVGAGAQTLIVNGDHDTLIASTGADQLIANGNFDTLRAGSGSDILIATGDNAVLVGGSGDGQQLTANGDNASITGGSGAGQQLTANGDNAVVTSGTGLDQVLTVNGNNATLVGRGSGDTLTAFGNNETLVGSRNETLTVFGNDSTLTGKGGTVTLAAFGNNDVLIADGSSCRSSDDDRGCGDDRDQYRHGRSGGDDADGSCGTGGSHDSSRDCDQTSRQSSADGACGSDGSTDHQSWSSRGSACEPPDGRSCGPDDRDGRDDCHEQSSAGLPQQILFAQGDNDTLIGGNGAVTIQADGNHNTLQAGKYGTQTLTANGDFDTLTGGGWSGNLTANGDNDTLIAGGVGQQTLTANGLYDTLIGGGGTNSLTATGLFDTLIAGTGVNMLSNTFEQCTYQVGLGAGDTTIVNGLYADGPANELDFGAGITDDRLWLTQSGNDLRIDIMGTQQDVTVANWFGDPTDQSQLQTITAGGNTLDNGRVLQLVQAMATFSAGDPGFDPTGTAQAPADPAVQTAIAASWHASA